MRLEACIFLMQCTIFCIQYNSGIAKAIYGPNVRRAREREFNYVVSIETIDENDESVELEAYHYCTGTLISKKDVLTAAHCFKQKLLNEVVVTVGSIDLRQGRNYYPSWWIIYEEWAAENNVELSHPFNDIAILRLAESVPGNIRPLRLSYRTNADTYGLNALMAGWGMIYNGEMDRFMRAAFVKVLSHAECERKIIFEVEERVDVGPNFLCSIAEPFALLSNGDSGGPLVYSGVLIGINKGTCLFPETCFHPDKINIHMSIDYYRRFIDDILENF